MGQPLHVSTAGPALAFVVIPASSCIHQPFNFPISLNSNPNFLSQYRFSQHVEGSPSAKAASLGGLSPPTSPVTNKSTATRPLLFLRMDAATTRVLGKSLSHKEKSNPPNPLRSKSSRTLMPEQRLRRPWTQSDLLAETPGWVGRTQPDFLANGGGISPRLLPAKVLVNVTVQGSLGPVQVMASMEWSVKRLVTATVQQYAKEGRRPQLLITETEAFKIHYSQFSLECLDTEEKLVDLGSRNFFLCPRSIAAAPAPAPAPAVVAQLPASSKEAERGPTWAPVMPVEWSKEAERGPRSAPAMPVEWLRFIVFVM